MSNPSRIKQLDDRTIGHIAAGEVVERPAQVVKELVENSIDAGSDNITIEVERGGFDLIRISDNGSGIHEDDLPL
ncbi:MAG: ATP-binding protein, partial [Candidatus Thermoplasmatota archaeon]|nr:ATP-binding protein [Candidatus Thermoplasmatota archaeon]